MTGDVFAAHFVGFITGRFGRGGRIGRPGRSHTHAQDYPFAFRNIPCQRAVGSQVLRDVLYLRGIYHQRGVFHSGLYRPLIVFPVRQRSRVHLRQRLFAEAFYARSGCQSHFGQAAACIGAFDDYPEIGSGRGRDRYDHRCELVESDVQRGIRAVDVEFRQRAVVVAFFNLQLALCAQRVLGGFYGQAARRKRSVGFQVDRNFAALRDGDSAFLVAVGDLRQVGHFRRRGDRPVRRVQRELVVFRHRVSDDAYVLERVGRLYELGVKLLRAFGARFRRSEITHRLVGLYPRAAGLTPARRVKDSDFDVQLGRFFQRGVQDVPPLFAEHFHVAVGYVVLADVADERAVDSGFFHRLEVFDNAFFRNVVRNPIPVNAGLDRVGRGYESRSERFVGNVLRTRRPCSATGGQRGSCQSAGGKFKKIFFHKILWMIYFVV